MSTLHGLPAGKAAAVVAVVVVVVVVRMCVDVRECSFLCTDVSWLVCCMAFS